MTSHEPYLQALTQTRQWCDAHVNPDEPARSLRSPQLRPPEYPDAWSCTTFHPEWIEQLVQRRAQLLSSVDVRPGLQPGRILCVLEEADTHMGEGEPASKGVIDKAYFPPWDSWFAHIALRDTSLLLAWIPAVFEALVEDARVVAATEPIGWLDDVLREPQQYGRYSFGGFADQLQAHPLLVVLRDAARRSVN